MGTLVTAACGRDSGDGTPKPAWGGGVGSGRGFGSVEVTRENGYAMGTRSVGSP
jgi:hypothetical protein